MLQIYTSNDLKLILGEALPMILGQMKNADNQFTRSIPQLHTKAFYSSTKRNNFLHWWRDLAQVILQNKRKQRKVL